MVNDLRIGAFVLDIDHLAFAQVQHVDDGTAVVVRYGTDDFLDRFAETAFDTLEDDFRTGNTDLVAFTAHILQEDRKMQLAAAGYLEGIGGIGLFNTQTDIDFQFLLKTFADVTGSDIFAALSLEGRCVDHEVHRHRRLFDRDLRHRFNVFAADRIADLDILDTGDQNDIAALRFIDRGTLQTLIVEEIGDLAVFLLAVGIHDFDVFVGFDDTAVNTADTDTSDIVVICQSGYLHFQRFTAQIRIRLYMGDDRLEKRDDIFVGIIDLITDDAVTGDTVQDREIKLFIVGFKIQEQIIYFINDFTDTGVLLVDLVDKEDRLQSLFQ